MRGSWAGLLCYCMYGVVTKMLRHAKSVIYSRYCTMAAVLFSSSPRVTMRHNSALIIQIKPRHTTLPASGHCSGTNTPALLNSSPACLPPFWTWLWAKCWTGWYKGGIVAAQCQKWRPSPPGSKLTVIHYDPRRGRNTEQLSRTFVYRCNCSGYQWSIFILHTPSSFNPLLESWGALHKAKC